MRFDISILSIPNAESMYVIKLSAESGSKEEINYYYELILKSFS